MSETPEPPYTRRYCAPGDGVEGGYTKNDLLPNYSGQVMAFGQRPDGSFIYGLGDKFNRLDVMHTDPKEHPRLEEWYWAKLRQVMGIPAEHVNTDQQSMSLKMNEFVDKHKELEAIRDQEVAELDEAVKAAVDAAVDEHGTKALFIHPRIASGSIMGMYFASMAQQALNQELETRRKLLFQKAAETTNEEDENNE